MRVISDAKLGTIAAPERIMAAVCSGFIANAAENLRPVLSSHLACNIGNRRAGDCHVKWGHLEQAEMFAVKVATGFCDKPGSGLPSGNGLMPLLPARTGAPLA